jgi:predicted nucleic acid-binding protein
MIFFDTSAIIPVFADMHVHSVPSTAAFHSVPAASRACSQHSLAEIFNTLTRPASQERATPSQAGEFLAYLRGQLKIVELAPKDYFTAIDALIRMNHSGPLIYDALLLQCARKVNAETIYTWNDKHFKQLAPDLASRIRTP